ncbi:MAG: carbohydrate ABC transporter permease [Chloroflexi bacterium AL-N1]|nr:carbohydrate ABC transporter permease [Chloroflexi bacterium AL-N1]NOK92197.1 carbohydrate ABC transporter permease [Chloroflexi bacterium AL-N15]
MSITQPIDNTTTQSNGSFFPRNKGEMLAINGGLSLLSIIILFPLLYAILTSLRPDRMGLVLAFSFAPDDFFTGHYIRLLSTDRFLRYMLNSGINSLGGAMVTTVVAALAGYAFARYTFRGRDVLLAFILGMLMLPGLTNLIPLYKLASDLHIRDTYLIMILVYGAYGIPLGIWIMRSFFISVPGELEEAASIDGANPWQTLVYVIVPVSMPGLTAVFLINFVYNWNDFLTALILLSSTAMKTAPVGLFDFQNQLSGNENELLAAACVIIMIPGIVLFLVARKAFFRGMAEGAIKG